MRPVPNRVYSGAVIAVVVLFIAGLFVGPAVTTPHSGISGNIVVGPDETVSEIDAVAGTIHIQGTVTGDLSGFAGTVLIDGTVEGDVDVAAGNLEISGTVMGDVSSASGSIHLHEGATIGGKLTASAGSANLDGEIAGDAQVVAETITLGETAQLRGSLVYDGNLIGNTDAVAGEITRDTTLGFSEFGQIQPFVSWFFAVSIFVLNLLLGAFLIGFFPRFSDKVVDTVRGQPARTALIGLGIVIAVPTLLLVTALTIVGLPITVVGFFTFVFVAWVGLVYGRLALGTWLLSLVGVDNRWLGLFVGIFVGAVLWEIPYIGGLSNFVLLLLGIGALLSVVYRRRWTVQRAEAAEYGYSNN